MYSTVKLYSGQLKGTILQEWDFISFWLKYAPASSNPLGYKPLTTGTWHFTPLRCSRPQNHHFFFNVTTRGQRASYFANSTTWSLQKIMAANWIPCVLKWNMYQYWQIKKVVNSCSPFGKGLLNMEESGFCIQGSTIDQYKLVFTLFAVRCLDVCDTQGLSSLVMGSVQTAYFWQVKMDLQKFHFKGGMWASNTEKVVNGSFDHLLFEVVFWLATILAKERKEVARHIKVELRCTPFIEVIGQDHLK